LLRATAASTARAVKRVHTYYGDQGLTATEAAGRKLSQDLCSNAEISSKRIGPDHKRRVKFLEPLQNLPFGYYALVINKDRIPKDSGLRFKRSFYKYINRMLYERLAKGGQNLRIIAGQVGGPDFTDSFRSYPDAYGLPSLFHDCQHTFADSASTPLIQLADLIARSLAYCFDLAKAGPHSQQFRELLRPREAGIQCWPWEPLPLPHPARRQQWPPKHRIIPCISFIASASSLGTMPSP